MGKFILSLLFFVGSSGWAFMTPTHLDCEGSSPFYVEQSGKKQHFKSGAHRIPFHQGMKLTILDRDQKKIAKLFPDAGLDGVLFDKKNYSASTDQRTYWRLLGPKAKTLLSCELKNE